MKLMARTGGFFGREHPTITPCSPEGGALTRALDQPGSPDEPPAVQTTTLTKHYTMRMCFTDLAHQLVEKIGLDCPIYVPSDAEANAPEQHAT